MADKDNNAHPGPAEGYSTTTVSSQQHLRSAQLSAGTRNINPRLDKLEREVTFFKRKLVVAKKGTPFDFARQKADF